MKKIIRKPTRDERPYVDMIRRRGGMDIYKHDWPAYQHLADAGLISLSPPRGNSKAFKRAVLPGREDW